MSSDEVQSLHSDTEVSGVPNRKLNPVKKNILKAVKPTKRKQTRGKKSEIVSDTKNNSFSNTVSMTIQCLQDNLAQLQKQNQPLYVIVIPPVMYKSVN